MRTYSHILFILICSLLIGCSTTSVSPEQEMEASIQTTEWLDRKFGFVEDAELRQMVQRVTSRLGTAISGAALESELSRSEAEAWRNYPWQVFILRSPDANAVSAGAGTIFISAGLVKRLESEAELAAVISHEMAHSLLGHIREAIAIAAAPTPGPQFVFTFEHELAADSLSVKILDVARYNTPSALEAIRNSYRGRGEPAPEERQYIQLRLAHLQQRIGALGEHLPSTENTREFQRVKQRL